MATPVQSVNVGDPIPTDRETLNGMLLAGRLARTGNRPNAMPLAAGYGGVIVVDGKNETGADLPKGRPVTLTGIGVYDLAAEDSGWQPSPLLTLGTPAKDTDRVAVTLEAIPDGEIGSIAVAGVVECDLYMGTADTARFARPTVGSNDYLSRAMKGPIEVLAVADGEESVRRAVVMLGGCCDDCHDYPLGPAQLVSDGYGQAVGIAQRVVHCDGTVECVVSGFSEDCGPDDIPVPPPPPVTVNEIRVELLIAGGGTDIRDITVTDGVTPVTQATNSSGRTTFLMPDGTYTVTLDDVFGGETVSWDLTVGVVDSGSGAVTDSFAVSGGATVICQFSIVSPP